MVRSCNRDSRYGDGQHGVWFAIGRWLLHDRLVYVRVKRVANFVDRHALVLVSTSCSCVVNI